ncbi:restriction endonuclease subunit S [Microbacterium sp. R86528]|uniref:restriction endonuclease subunit S n=1 Tax=Microbacterium sp. R86528 TaxID=3093864 RepID=UPI0037CB2419
MSLNLDKSTWQRVAFGDVVRNVNETLKHAAANGIDRVIAMEHMDPGELKIQRWGDVAEGTTFTRRVRPGQTLFGKRRAYQRKVSYAEFDAICSGDIYTFEADENRMLGNFLPFIVQSDPFFDHALDTSAGSLSPRTNWRDLANFEFDLPSLDEQRRIADLLWVVERHLQVISGECARVEHLRGTYIEANLPLNSSTVPLGDAASITSGVTLSPARRSLPDTAPYLRVANVQRGNLDLSEIKQVGATAPEAASKGVRPGDVLVVEGHASVDEIGRAAIWERDDSPLFQNHLFRVRASEGFRPNFILEWINSVGGRGYIRTVAKSTSGLNTINGTVLKSMPVPAVPVELQDRLLARLDSIDHGRSALMSEAAALSTLRASIITETFGGN